MKLHLSFGSGSSGAIRDYFVILVEGLDPAGDEPDTVTLEEGLRLDESGRVYRIVLVQSSKARRQKELWDIDGLYSRKAQEGELSDDALIEAMVSVLGGTV